MQAAGGVAQDVERPPGEAGLGSVDSDQVATETDGEDGKKQINILLGFILQFYIYLVFT